MARRSWRWLRVRIEHLPQDAALLRAVDPERAMWTAAMEMSAQQIEHGWAQTRFLAQAVISPHQKKGAAPVDFGPPVRIPRPGEARPDPRKPSTPQQIKAFFTRR